MGESFNYHCEYFWQSDIIRNELGKHLGPFITMFDISYNLILTQIKIVDFIQLILAVIVHRHCSPLQIPVTLFIFVNSVILCSDLETVWLMHQKNMPNT